MYGRIEGSGRPAEGVALLSLARVSLRARTVSDLMPQLGIASGGGIPRIAPSAPSTARIWLCSARMKRSAGDRLQPLPRRGRPVRCVLGPLAVACSHWLGLAEPRVDGGERNAPPLPGICDRASRCRQVGSGMKPGVAADHRGRAGSLPCRRAPVTGRHIRRARDGHEARRRCGARGPRFHTGAHWHRRATRKRPSLWRA